MCANVADRARVTGIANGWGTALPRRECALPGARAGAAPHRGALRIRRRRRIVGGPGCPRTRAHATPGARSARKRTPFPCPRTVTSRSRNLPRTRPRAARAVASGGIPTRGCCCACDVVVDVGRPGRRGSRRRRGPGRGWRGRMLLDHREWRREHRRRHPPLRRPRHRPRRAADQVRAVARERRSSAGSASSTGPAASRTARGPAVGGIVAAHPSATAGPSPVSSSDVRSALGGYPGVTVSFIAIPGSEGG